MTSAGMIMAIVTVTVIHMITTMNTRMARMSTPTPMIMIMTTSMTKIAAMITAMTTIMAIHMIMIMRTAMRTRTNMTETAGLPLLVWLSPSFPVGAFA